LPRNRLILYYTIDLDAFSSSLDAVVFLAERSWPFWHYQAFRLSSVLLAFSPPEEPLARTAEKWGSSPAFNKAKGNQP